MFETLKTMLSYPFILRALIVGFLVCICSALLGVNLVLKKFSMIGDGLSHVGFGALAVAAVMNVAPLKLAIPVVVVSAYVLMRVSEKKTVNGDTAIALISTTAMAIGVTVVSLTTRMTTDISNYMFGSILAVSENEVIFSVLFSSVVILIYVLFYNRIFSVTFDETFAQATGINVSLFNMLLAFLTAVTVVLGMKMMGTLLISSLIVFPPFTAMKVCKRFSVLAVTSALISSVCFFFGILFSFVFSIPVGASVVLVNVVMFVLVTLIKKIIVIIKKK